MDRETPLLVTPLVPCSPHTRGWTGQRDIDIDHVDLFPAHAGMDRFNFPAGSPD